MRPLTVLALVLMVSVGLPAVAPQAAEGPPGTIVFEQGSNIWIMAGDDPATARQVTVDGTSAEPYKAPSQDDEGRIYAARGQSLEEIVRIDQDGEELGPPLQLPPRAYESGSSTLLPTSAPTARPWPSRPSASTRPARPSARACSSSTPTGATPRR